MKTLKLFDCQPNQISIDGSIQLALQRTRRLGGGCFAIALLPNQSRGLVEAMRLVSFPIVNQSFVVQFADHQIVRARTWQQGSAFHFQDPCVLDWRKLFFITSVWPGKSIGMRRVRRNQDKPESLKNRQECEM
jgi:hypothetical protein